MNINQQRDSLKERLKNKKSRDAFVSAYIDETIPFQIRALREQEDRRWTQEDLASRANMKQERISTLENPNYASYSLRTLKQLASAFDVALIVRFVPFSELAEWQLNLSSESLNVPSFSEDPYFQAKEGDTVGYNQYPETCEPTATSNVVLLEAVRHQLARNDNPYSPENSLVPAAGSISTVLAAN